MTSALSATETHSPLEANGALARPRGISDGGVSLRLQLHLRESGAISLNVGPWGHGMASESSRTDSASDNKTPVLRQYGTGRLSRSVRRSPPARALPC